MNNLSLRHQVLTNPIHFLAFGFGAGLSPKAPGTVGTLASLPFILLAHWLSFPLWILFLITAVGGTWLADKSSKALGVHDHPGIVIDEFAGMMLTLMFIPLSWFTVLAGFCFFRLFDIWKPWPIRWVDQQVQGGLGIMMDDLLAGLYAALCLFILMQSSLGLHLS
jgi:phosphatidylglycerophosphatase A